jgi:hypothetical protein
VRRLRIGFDFDNTMVGLTQGIVDFHNHRHPDHRQLTMADHTSYDAAPCPCWRDTVKAFYQCEGFFLAYVRPYPFALDVVERAAHAHDVEIVSSYLRNDTTPRKRELLKQHRPALVPLLRGVHAPRRGKGLVRKDGTMMFPAREYPPPPKYVAADVIVEDAPSQLMTECSAHPDAVIVAIHQPYNCISSVRPTTRVYAVAETGWRAVEAIILATAARS